MSIQDDLSNIQTTQVENATNAKAGITETAVSGSGANTNISADIQLQNGKLSKADLLILASGYDTTFEKMKTKIAGMEQSDIIAYAQKTAMALALKVVEQKISDVNTRVPSYVRRLLDKIPHIKCETAGQWNNAVQLGTVRNENFKIVPQDGDVHTGKVYEGVNLISLGKECDIYIPKKMWMNFFNSPESLSNVVNLIVAQLSVSQDYYKYDFIANTICTYNFPKVIDLSSENVSDETSIRNFTYKLFKAIEPVQWANKDWNLTSDCDIISGKDPEELIVFLPSFFKQKIEIALLSTLFNEDLVSKNINAVLKPENIIILPNSRLINDVNNKETTVTVDSPVVASAGDGSNIQQYLIGSDGKPFIVLFSKNAFAYASQFEVDSSAQWINYGSGLNQIKKNWHFDLWKYNFEKGAKIILPADLLN